MGFCWLKAPKLIGTHTVTSMRHCLCEIFYKITKGVQTNEVKYNSNSIEHQVIAIRPSKNTMIRSPVIASLGPTVAVDHGLNRRYDRSHHHECDLLWARSTIRERHIRWQIWHSKLLVDGGPVAVDIQ